MSRLLAFLFCICAGSALLSQAWAAAPEVSNVQVQQRPGSFLVDVNFDLFDADGDLMEVVLMFSQDGGQTWPVRCDSLSGDFFHQVSGTGKTITWEPRGQFPDFQSDSCKLRVLATDHYQWPYLDFFRVNGTDTIPLTPGQPDTVGFGHPFRLTWRGISPVAEGLDPAMLAQMDSIYPYYDGILGYKWRVLPDNCIPWLDDCWHPRFFNEATGDSISYFGSMTGMTFLNDGSGTGPFGRLLESGEQDILVNALDFIQDEVPEYQRAVSFVVNYDPETVILNGETDWAHPADPQVYPYYTLLNDPTETKYPFQAGERIPDRTYVVFKALFRDDPRDAVVDPSFEMGMTGHLRGVRQNLTGGLFSFQSDASLIDTQPDWPAGTDGWYADTLGFMTAPRTEFTFNMQGVDEHGRRDGTPATLAFDVGYPPCVQCVEILPGMDQPSEFSPDLECYDPGAGSHPCFGDTTSYYIKSASGSPLPGRTYLNQTSLNYLAIDKITLAASFTDVAPEPAQYFVFPCNVYSLKVAFHGQDDPQEAWANPQWRSMAWMYQVDYDCDPWNSIQDGGGLDDISRVNWGTDSTGLMEVEPTSGLWHMNVQVSVPQQLVNTGASTFYQIIMFTMANGDAELADALYHICMRQLSSGTIEAVALDQTQCGAPPLGRPAKYHIFHTVRPSISEPGSNSWRTCYPGWPGIQYSLEMDPFAMASNGGEPVTQYFRLTLQDIAGQDVNCDAWAAASGPAQRPWHEQE